LAACERHTRARATAPSARRFRGCHPLLCYVDDIEAWSVNEVAINWNAPLAWVAAYLDDAGQRE